MNRYINKICFITASTQGIGLGIAERMAQEGGQVIICSRKEKNLNSALEKLKNYKVEGYLCNVGNKEERLKILQTIEEKYGRLDVLVCNQASSTHFGNQLEIEEKSYDKMFDLNVKATFFLIQESLELLRKVLSSVTAQNPHYSIGVYGMTKAALENMVKWMSKELINDNIRVNAIAPGLIKTEFAAALWKDNKNLQEKSLGTPEQIASVVAMMCSSDGSFVNGETFLVHGGYPNL